LSRQNQYFYTEITLKGNFVLWFWWIWGGSLSGWWDWGVLSQNIHCAGWGNRFESSIFWLLKRVLTCDFAEGRTGIWEDKNVSAGTCTKNECDPGRKWIISRTDILSTKGSELHFWDLIMIMQQICRASCLSSRKRRQ